MTFGYVTRDQQMTLHKLDLSSKKYVNVIDLEKYDCIPTAVAFVPLGMTLEKHCYGCRIHKTPTLWPCLLLFVKSSKLLPLLRVLHVYAVFIKMIARTAQIKRTCS